MEYLNLRQSVQSAGAAFTQFASTRDIPDTTRERSAAFIDGDVSRMKWEEDRRREHRCFLQR